MTNLSKMEFNRYLKNISLKSLELIIQSEEGQKQHTFSASNPHTVLWFNLALESSTKVKQELQKSFDILFPEQDRPICLEIIADIDGKSLSMEVWSIHFSNTLYDASLCNVYNQMSIMLRSILVASRTTQSYTLARQDNAITFSHKISKSYPDYTVLGRDLIETEVYSIKTPYGKLSFRMACRTSLILVQESPNLDSILLHGSPLSQSISTQYNLKYSVTGVFGYRDSLKNLPTFSIPSFSTLEIIEPVKLNSPDILSEESLLSVSTSLVFPSKSDLDNIKESHLIDDFEPLFSDYSTSHGLSFRFFLTTPKISFWEENKVDLIDALTYIKNDLNVVTEKYT